MSWWDEWGPALPVEGGLVVSGTMRAARLGERPKSVGSDIIRRMLESVNTGIATRGRSYARNGQTVTMTIEKGRIHATVQGSAATPYSVTIACTVPEDRRQRLIEAFEHALVDPSKGIPARGTPALRDEIDTCALLDGVDITAKCTCPYGEVCKHCIALAYVAADRLDGSPIAVATFMGVRDDDLSAARGTRDSTPNPPSVPEYDARRQAKLARTLARLDGRAAPSADDVIRRASKVLRPPASVAEQLGLGPAEERS